MDLTTMPVKKAITKDLKEVRCGKCNRLVAKANITKGSIVECYCKSCKHYTYISQD